MIGTSKRVAPAGAAIVLHNGVTALAAPTVGTSVAAWNHANGSTAIEKFELTITATGSVTMTNAVLHSVEGGVGIVVATLPASIALTATKGYRVRLDHSPLASAYALEAAFTGTVTVTARPLRFSE